MVTSAITIDADPEIVWAISQHPRLYPRFIDWVREAWVENDGPLQEGRAYLERAKPGPKEVLGRTSYRQSLHFRALPAFRPLGFIIERTLMKRQMQRDFDHMVLPQLKRLAEARAERDR